MSGPILSQHSKDNWSYFCVHVTDASDSETVLSLNASDVRCLCLFFFFTPFSLALSREQLTHCSYPFGESEASGAVLAVRHCSRTACLSDRPASDGGLFGI